MELHCDTCARVRTFEPPVRADDLRASCPERACTACGATIVIAPVILLMDRRPRVLLRRAA
ncbi:hypothetical protein ABT297_21920 [Dactylosporangium sp. NPDC000555]|uniref:hypothetical protein n=1 Tax=Dactylosporangium sp. NPDC000555 TaxID=3154260 RepID=UPI00331FC1B8